MNGQPSELVKGGEGRSTNNRMELTAAIEALKTRNAGESVELYTDSEYLRLGITQWLDAWIRNGWIRGKGKPVLNKDLWLELHTQNSRLQVDWRWVKAHAGHTFNEIVDHAAREAAISAASLDDSETKIADGRPSTAGDVPASAKYAIAAVDSGTNRSAWAVISEASDFETVLEGIEVGASVHRALLTGTVRLLRSLQENGGVRLSTDSEYLYKGATQWLDGWWRRGWRKSDDKPVANKDLWIEIHGQLKRLDVEWQLNRRTNGDSSDSFVRIAARIARDVLARSGS